jgi:hypothetical protein
VLRRIYAPLTDGSYYSRKDALPGMLSAENPAKLLVTSAQSAEIIKHASNAFLALKISFINAVANLAESVDADIEDIAAGMGLDSRIGPKFLRAGLGYGGSCFPKDVAAFYWVAQQQGVDFQILEEVRKINATQQEIFFNKVRSRFGPCAARSWRRSGFLQGRYRRYSRLSCDRRHQEADCRWSLDHCLRSGGHGKGVQGVLPASRET